MQETIKPEYDAAANINMAGLLAESLLAPAFKYDFICLSPGDGRRQDYLDTMAESQRLIGEGRVVDGIRLRTEAELMLSIAWEDTVHNLVTNVGRNDVLDKYFKGSSYTAAWYLGLKGTGTAAAGDTALSHAGWSEVTPYSGNRPAITFGTTSSQSNTATAVSYSITGSATVAGAFIQSANSGTSGILYSAGDFGSSRSVANGDTLNVTPTVTA